MAFNEFGTLNVPRRLLLGPGPMDVNPRVLRVMSNPITGYLDSAYFDVLEDVSALLKSVYRTSQNTMVVAGSGSCGMEAGFHSLLETGDTVVICSYGHFCERMILMCQRMDVNVVAVRSKWGRVMDPQLLSDELSKHKRVKLVAAIHAETSTGVLQPLEDLSKIANDHGSLFATDMVTSLSGCRVEFDEWGIDYAYSGTQKCLAGPPGLSPIAVSDRALNVVRMRDRPPASWYMDLDLIDRYWGHEHEHHHTSPVSMMYALREALVLALEEGLETRFERHARTAAALRAGVSAMGLELPVPDGEQLNQLTVIAVPNGIDDNLVRQQLLDEYSIEIGRGLAALRGKIWRIGLMGESCRTQNVFALLSALESVLIKNGFEVEIGTGVAAASKELSMRPVTLG